MLRGELDLTDEGALELFKDGLEEKWRALLAASAYKKKIGGVWHACALGSVAVYRKQVLANVSSHIMQQAQLLHDKLCWASVGQCWALVLGL